MISAVLPASVATVESYGALPGEALLPEEEPLVARAVPRRRAEFTTTRSCARRALAELGLPAVPLLSGPAREPLWPDGVVGSLTHCAGYRAAAVARAGDLATIGIDAEPHEPLPDGVRERVALGEELDQLRRLGRRNPGLHWDRLLFSAKESVYKAWYPLARCRLGFDDATVAFSPGADPTSGSFTAELLARGLPPVAGRAIWLFDGRYVVRDRLLVTAVALPAGD
ncbi:MAG TPA: 4'-phosphopantetheinyl transferase superfamily protein [Mycobacteriales bacterium]|nr:4'-phosphopantetheinyl transferase superfamily protein [Mycobacteriales bacterium]